MSRLGINTGNNANDSQGDTLRSAMGKINANFSELYEFFGDGFNLESYANSSGISSTSEGLTGDPSIEVSGIVNSGITTTEYLEVRNITSTGIITAVQYFGDGSQLENVIATNSGVEALDNDVRKGVAQELNFRNGITVSAPDGVGRVDIDVTAISEIGDNVITGVLTATDRITVGAPTTFTDELVVNGNARITGILTIGTGSITLDANARTIEGVDQIKVGQGSSTLVISQNLETGSLQVTDELSGDIKGEVGFGSTSSINTTGIVTASAFYGDGSNLTGIDATALKDSGGNVKIQANTSGAVVTGVLTATSFVGDGSNLTGLSTFSGDYADLTNKPTIPSDTGDLTNSVGFITAGSLVGYATETFVNNAVANLVDSAPSTLDTLNELASALGDDPNFATTITTSLGNKANLSGASFSGVVTATSLQVGGVIEFNDNNIKIGDNTTGANLLGEYNNIFMGVGAGNSTTFGEYNNFFGLSAGKYNISGTSNNFLGSYAGYFNIDGNYNNFFGKGAGFCNTTAWGNNFFGSYAGYRNTTGENNIFFGTYAGYDSTTGSDNTFIGRRAGCRNQTGNNNAFIGHEGGKINKFGSNNLYFGNFTGVTTSANYKVLIGSGFGVTRRFDVPKDATDSGTPAGSDIQLAIGVRTDNNPSNYWIVGDENFNIGIGTTNPKVRLQIDGVLGFGTFKNSPFAPSRSNIRIGDETTGANLTTGYDNIFIGGGGVGGAGNKTTTGYRNIFLGPDAGSDNTDGAGNVFIGYNAGSGNLTGFGNLFVGSGAGYANTTGEYNTFFGSYSGYYHYEGDNNSFFGSLAGYDARGSYNNFFGRNSGRANRGNYNNFFGGYAGWQNTFGNYNNSFGTGSGSSNTTGTYNNFFGYYSGSRNTTGSNNIFFGSWTGASTTASNKIIFGRGFNFNNVFDAPNTTKDTQFAVGVRTDANPSKYWLVGDENFNIGIGTTNPTTKLQVGSASSPQVIGFGTVQGFAFPSTNVLIGDKNTGSSLTPQVSGAWRGLNNNFIGAGAGAATTIGIGNNFFGLNAGCSNTRGSYNNFFGLYAGCSNTTGSNNNFLGSYTTGVNNTTGEDNNFFGPYAGYYNTTGDENNFIGRNAGKYNTTGSYNNIMGFDGGYNNTIGRNNNFFGELAGYGNTSGNDNNMFGLFAGVCNTSGNRNNFFGRNVASCNTTGSNNIIIGEEAGRFNTTGNHNTFLGSFTGISNTASNKIILGRGFSTNFLFDSPDTTKDTQFAVGIRTSTFASKYWLVGDENFNIGIGTINPTSKLDVNGGARFRGAIYDNNNVVGAANSILTSTGSGVVWSDITAIPVGDANTLDGQDGSYYLDYTNFVGIATEATTATNVVGTANRILYNNATDTTTTSDNLVFDGNDVGIGTTNPTTKLQVGGVLGFGTFFNGFYNSTNIRIGDNTTGANLTSGYDNIFMGVGAGNSTTSGCYNNFFGPYAGFSNTTGSDNNFLGGFAGYYNTTGSENNFFGNVAGVRNTTGNKNNFIGAFAGRFNTTGSRNNFFGFNAGYCNTTGCNNNFFGYFAGRSNTTASGNNFLGNSAGEKNTTGCYNNFFGPFAGYCNTDGYNNNFFGQCAGFCNTTGFGNNFFGRFTGFNNNTGNNNIIIGEYAGCSNTTGNHNIFLGSFTGRTSAASNKIILGRGLNTSFRFDSPNTTSDAQLAIGIRTSTDASKYWVVGDENFNIGIGTINPTSKLDVNGTLNVTGVSTFQGNVNLGDDDRLYFGGGNDLEIYHDSAIGRNYIDSNADIWIRSRVNESDIYVSAYDDLFLRVANGENAIIATGNGSVDLYYDNSKKFETTGYGVSITGNIDVDNTTSIGSSTSSLSTLTQTAIHTELAVATYRSVEYTIQATEGTNFHATKILALHNGTTAYHSEYGTIFNNSSVASFDVDISGGNLRLLATGASASQTDYVVNFVATKV